jgi:hypothetical protein
MASVTTIGWFVAAFKPRMSELPAVLSVGDWPGAGGIHAARSSQTMKDGEPTTLT